MKNGNYFPRVTDRLLEEKLTSSGALLIEGPKWCGKTWSGRNASRSEIDFQDPDKRSGYIKLADAMPSRLLDGEKPRLIDEWQEIPIIWDAVRYDVDKSGLWGQYILTGSATPRDKDEDKPRHTGTGRIARLRMRPMSLFESRESNGTVSLSDLFKGSLKDVVANSSLTIPDIAKSICRGGWPSAVVNDINSVTTARNYVEAVINTDVQMLDGIDRNPSRVRQLLRSYARNISTMASLSTILEDIRANDTAFSETTFYSYVNALRRLFLIEDIPAWKPSLRSKSAIRTSDKRQLVDPSIAVAVLHADPDSLMNDFNYFGFLFESLVTRDIRIYSQAIYGEVNHYRDKDGLEADLVIRLEDGRWAPIEVKLGSKEIEEGASHLLEMKKKIDTSKVGDPSFMMVVTGGQFAYRRPDGVYVVPVGCLRD